MNRFTEIYIELVASGYSYDEAEKLALIKYDEEEKAKKPKLSQIQKEGIACKVMSKLRKDLELTNINFSIDIHAIVICDAFDFIVKYSSHKHVRHAITYTLSFKDVVSALTEDSSTYNKMLAYFCMQILRMGV